MNIEEEFVKIIAKKRIADIYNENIRDSQLLLKTLNWNLQRKMHLKCKLTEITDLKIIDEFHEIIEKSQSIDYSPELLAKMNRAVIEYRDFLVKNGLERSQDIEEIKGIKNSQPSSRDVGEKTAKKRKKTVKAKTSASYARDAQAILETDPEKAKEITEEGINLYPHYAKTYYINSQANMALENYELALQNGAKANEIDGTKTGYIWHMMRLTAYLKRYDETMAWCVKLDDLRGTTQDRGDRAYREIIQACINRGDIEEALAWNKECKKKYKKDTFFYLFDDVYEKIEKVTVKPEGIEELLNLYEKVDSKKFEEDHWHRVIEKTVSWFERCYACKEYEKAQILFSKIPEKLLNDVVEHIYDEERDCLFEMLRLEEVVAEKHVFRKNIHVNIDINSDYKGILQDVKNNIEELDLGTVSDDVIKDIE